MKSLSFFLLFFHCMFSSAQEIKDSRGDFHKSEKKQYLKKAVFKPNPNTANYDLIFQRLELILDPAEHYVAGTVTSHFKPQQPLTTIYFDCSLNLKISEVLYQGQKLDFTQLESKELKIDFPSVLPVYILDSLSIKYSGIPDRSGSAGDAFTTSRQDGTPVLYTLSEPYGAREWFPTKQSLNDKIDRLQLKIITPDQYSVAGNGLLLSENLLPDQKKMTVWQTDYPIPAYLIAVGITNYTILKDTMGNPPFPFLNYLYPATAQSTTVLKNIEWTKEIMNIYESIFGEYPYRREKYGHMEFGWGGGMEHATMSSMGSWGKGLIAHELAHQWFGDKVTCSTWNDIWLNEGFATFGEHLANEKLLMNPPQYRNYLYNQINFITGLPGGSVYVADQNLENTDVIFSSRLSYAKGAYVLKMMRWILGDELFFKALKDYLTRPELAYQFASTDDFKKSVLLSTGKDFTAFFQDWIYGEGYPVYTIKWNQTANGRLHIKISQTQSHTSVDFFELPLPVKVKGASGEIQNLVLNNNANNQIFSENVTFKVDEIVFNDDYQIITKDPVVVRDPALLNLSENTADSWTVFPNPVREQIYLSGPAEAQTYHIVNQEGRIIQTGSFLPGISIKVASLTKGLYILQVGRHTFRFIKK